MLITGCAGRMSEPKIVFHADVAFTKPERECMDLASAKWDDQTAGVAAVDFVYDYTPGMVLPSGWQKYHTVSRFTSETPELVAKEDDYFIKHGKPFIHFGWARGDIHMAWPGPIEMVLVMDRIQDPLTCRITVMHELGHVFGLEHDESNKSNIMYPSVDPKQNPSNCLSVEDLYQFCDHNVCAPYKMKVCN